MDIYGLAAANLATGARSTPIGARAESHYFSSQFTLPRLNARVLGSLAMSVGVLLIFGMGLI